MSGKTKKNETKNSKKSEKSEKSFKSKKENEDENDVKNIPIEKVHIYNNNRHLQKSNSAGNIRLFFEPYYSELKNSTSNNLFNTKPLKKTIIQINWFSKQNPIYR